MLAFVHWIVREINAFDLCRATMPSNPKLNSAGRGGTGVDKDPHIQAFTPSVRSLLCYFSNFLSCASIRRLAGGFVLFVSKYTFVSSLACVSAPTQSRSLLPHSFIDRGLW